jgi:uncharacterized lipoprotein
MKQLLYALVLILLAGCAFTPEAKLLKGYETSLAVVQGTTVLVSRDAISVPEAERVHALGTTSKAVLDSAKESLKACRASGGKCDGAIANINLGSGVLMELENYLKAKGSK